MAHFSNQVQFKIMEGVVRLSVRVQDQCVVEHLISIRDFESVIHCASESWIGEGLLQAKVKGGNILLRVLGTTRFVYSIPSRAFSEICNEFLSREG